MKRIAVLQDFSCFGKCSMTVTLPVLSAAGFECVPLPVLLLSSHTAYPNPAKLGLTDFSAAAMQQWRELGVAFDAILIGYLGTASAVGLAGDFIDAFRTPQNVVLLDPAMADNGKLYGGLPPDFPIVLRDLCEKADILLPNETEAALLLAPETPPTPADAAVALGDRYAADIILTGCAQGGRFETRCCEHRSRTATVVSNDRVPGSFHGTGDLFAAVFTAAYLHGKSLPDSAGIAARFTEQCVRYTAAQSRDAREGLIFEPFLKDLSAQLG